MSRDSDETQVRIWQVIAAIPEGRVTTYGDVALRAGLPGAARRVGHVLKQLPDNTTLPWHRVINAQGRVSLPADAGKRQRRRLEKEGVCFKPGGSVDLQRFRW
ncbi:MAG: MGMT family protein [Pseudomonadota bacterium]